MALKSCRIASEGNESIVLWHVCSISWGIISRESPGTKGAFLQHQLKWAVVVRAKGLTLTKAKAAVAVVAALLYKAKRRALILRGPGQCHDDCLLHHWIYLENTSRKIEQPSSFIFRKFRKLLSYIEEEQMVLKLICQKVVSLSCWKAAGIKCISSSSAAKQKGAIFKHDFEVSFKVLSLL